MTEEEMTLARIDRTLLGVTGLATALSVAIERGIPLNRIMAHFNSLPVDHEFLKSIVDKVIETRKLFDTRF